MHNKEVSQKLQRAFLKQPPARIAKLCANFLMDINKFYCLKQLSEEEKKHFLERIELNISELYKFVLSKEDDLELKIHSWDFSNYKEGDA